MAKPASPDHGVLRFLTCGSVDDGKSTLIGRLLFDCKVILADALQALERTSLKRGHQALDLSLLTDGLQAEREQGITIDVAYRYFSTGTRKFILADAPGHEQYTRNMITAASTADLAILLVDARKGVLAQTRRHATIAHLLGIRHLVVAVNKMDLVNWSQEVFERIQEDFLDFARSLALEDVRFLPISARDGDLVVDRGARLDWYEGPTLLELLETAELPDRRRELPFRFPIQLVLRATDFRGYAGRIESGELKVGDPVTLLPSGLSSRIREIHLGETAIPSAEAGQSVTLLLDDAVDLSRGDLLASSTAAPGSSKQVEATLCWLAETPLSPTRRLWLRHGSGEVRAIVSAVHHRLEIHSSAEVATASLGLNEIGGVSLRLQQPIHADPYSRDRAQGAFILVDEETHATVAAGLIRALA